MRCEKCNTEIDNDSVLALCCNCFEKYIEELNILYYSEKGQKDNENTYKKTHSSEKA